MVSVMQDFGFGNATSNFSHLAFDINLRSYLRLSDRKLTVSRPPRPGFYIQLYREASVKLQETREGSCQTCWLANVCFFFHILVLTTACPTFAKVFRMQSRHSKAQNSMVWYYMRAGKPKVKTVHTVKVLFQTAKAAKQHRQDGRKF